MEINRLRKQFTNCKMEYHLSKRKVQPRFPKDRDNHKREPWMKETSRKQRTQLRKIPYPRLYIHWIIATLWTSNFCVSHSPHYGIELLGIILSFTIDVSYVQRMVRRKYKLSLEVHSCLDKGRLSPESCIYQIHLCIVWCRCWAQALSLVPCMDETLKVLKAGKYTSHMNHWDQKAACDRLLHSWIQLSHDLR